MEAAEYVEIYCAGDRYDVRHVCDAVRRAFPVKKVTSSRSKKETTVIAETELDEAALREAIRATGYDAGEIRKEPWGKKGLFGR